MSRRRSSPLDRVLGRIDDLDAQNLAILARRLERERDLMETVLDTLREGVLVLSHDGAVEYANASAAHLLGFPSEPEGRPDLRRLAPDLAAALDLPVDSAALSREVEVRYPESRVLRLHLARVSDSQSPELARRVAVLSDVTAERVQTEDRVESERIDSIVALAAGVAHEVGNPLNAIGIHLQLLEREAAKLGDSPSARKVRESAAVCRSEIARLDGIVRDFLGAVRPAPPALADTDLVAVVADAVALLRDQMEQLGVRVSVDVASGVPPILGDRNQVKQALFNVLKNALEAMDRGGEIDVAIAHDDEWVSVEVRDTGVGIPVERLTRVFDAYYTTKGSGAGVGMLILLRIMRAHGGTVDIRSTPGSGTAVTLRFPLRHRRVRTLEAPKA
ncbi:MAG: sensor histidine kinase [Verrucomicrobiota bacterium]